MTAFLYLLFAFLISAFATLLIFPWLLYVIMKNNLYMFLLQDNINILNATKKGLTTALKELVVKPDIILVDALTGIDTLGIPYKSIIKGDAKSYSIAAASIIAKVTRDRIMRQWNEIYPEYEFEKHKGYGTSSHIAVIKEKGICPIHRKSFVKNFI